MFGMARCREEHGRITLDMVLGATVFGVVGAAIGYYFGTSASLVIASAEREAEEPEAPRRIFMGEPALVGRQALRLRQLVAHLLVGDLGILDLLDESGAHDVRANVYPDIL